MNGPDLSLPYINQNRTGLVYNDFDYVGYTQNRSTSQFFKPPARERKPQGVSKATSPRIVSGHVSRSDNHGTHRILRQTSTNGRNQTRSTLPDILKRGPINKDKNITKRVVGLSLQKKDVPGKEYLREKRTSIESTAKSHKNTKARTAILKAQQEIPKPKKSFPTFRMPDRTNSI